MTTTREVIARCRCGERIHAEGTAADYPYDPGLDSYDLRGLDLLCTMEDRRTAQSAFELHWTTAHRDECRLEQGSAARDAQEWRDTMGRLKGIAEGARDGADGQHGVELFRRMLKQGDGYREDYTTLRAFEKALGLTACRKVGWKPKTEVGK